MLFFLGGVYQLTIKNSNLNDTGTYICRAANEIGKTECSAELSIEKAPEFTKKLEKLVAAEQCEAEWTVIKFIIKIINYNFN